MKRNLLNNTSLSQGLVWAGAAALVLGLSALDNAAHAQGKAAAAIERALEKAPDQAKEALEKVLEKQQEKEAEKAERKAGKDDDEKDDDDPKDDDGDDPGGNPGDEPPGEDTPDDDEPGAGDDPDAGGEGAGGDEPGAGDGAEGEGPDEGEVLIVDEELIADLVADAELIAAQVGLVLNLPEGFTLESGTFDVTNCCFMPKRLAAEKSPRSLTAAAARAAD